LWVGSNNEKTLIFFSIKNFVVQLRVKKFCNVIRYTNYALEKHRLLAPPFDRNLYPACGELLTLTFAPGNLNPIKGSSSGWKSKSIKYLKL